MCQNQYSNCGKCWLAAVSGGACVWVGTGHALFSGYRALSVLCLQLFHNSKTILAKITNQPECRTNKGNFLIALLLDTYNFFFLLKRGPQCSQLLIREEAGSRGRFWGRSRCGQGHTDTGDKRVGSRHDKDCLSQCFRR